MATHDYIIDNSTGANVRADINNALAAIVSNNSNSSSPSTTYAYQWWADTSNNVLKIRNSANNAWIELLQLDGTLTLEDGSASTPALAFRDDLNTGIFSSAADTFNIATGGATAITVASNQRVGIGQTDPDRLLHLAGPDTAIIRLENTDSSLGSSQLIGGIEFEKKDPTGAGVGIAGAIRLKSDSSVGQAASMFFATSNSSGNDLVRMKIDFDGRVLIGGATSINASTNADDLQVGASSQSNQTGITLGSAVASSLRFMDAANDSSGHITYNHSNDEMTIKANDIVRITADTFFAPNIKIGSSNDHSSAKIVVQGSNNNSGTNSVFIKNSDETPLFQLRNDGAFFTGIDGNSPYFLTTSSAVNCFISSDGTLRRSTSSVRYKKDIADATFGLADVLKLKPKTFKNNATGEFADGKTYAGFTAEDIHDLGLTEFVQYNEDNEPDALAYGNMVALMAKAIQELNDKVAALEAA